MPDYQKAKIYAIMSPHTTDVYIGSTCLPLHVRLKLHINQTGRVCISKKIIDLGDAYIHLIEEYPCNTHQELLIKEGEYIRNTLFCINKIISGRTRIEHYYDNRDHMLMLNKKNYESHKEQRMENQRLYRAAKKLTPS